MPKEPPGINDDDMAAQREVYLREQREKSSEKIAHHFLHQKVQKIKGYKYPGVIVSVFYTLDGKIRYVVEADHPSFRGMLHIFSDADLEER
jgi:hypothetical protein